MGIGDKPALKMLVQVTTAFTGLTSLAVALQGSCGQWRRSACCVYNVVDWSCDSIGWSDGGRTAIRYGYA